MILAIVPMYGFPEITTRCITSVLKNAGTEIEILVVDDGSSEPFQDDRVQVLRLEKNSGYTNATNQGLLWAIKQNKYGYVLFLNNDTEGEPDFVKLLLEAILKDPSIAVAGSTRIIPSETGFYLENFGIDLVSGYQAYTKEDMDKEIAYVPWVPICSALVPMEAIFSVGILDRRMKTFSSDNDFCIRVHEMGYRVALVPKSKVKHYHQHTVKHHKLDGTQDQLVLLEKLACTVKKQFLDNFPLNWPQGTWGKLEFTTYHKDNNDDQLNQPATA